MNALRAGRLISHTVFILGALTAFACDDQESAPIGQGDSNDRPDAKVVESGTAAPTSEVGSSDTDTEQPEIEAGMNASSPSLRVDSGDMSSPSEGTSSVSNEASDAASPNRDASVQPETSPVLPQIDAGPQVPIDPVFAELLVADAVLLDEQALTACTDPMFPFPSQELTQRDCEACPDDVRACPVVTEVAAIDSYFNAVIALGRDADWMQVLLHTLMRQASGTLGQEPAASNEQNLAVVQAALSGGINGVIEGNVAVEFTAPSCTTAVSALRPFAAQCDRALAPDADMRCKGECAVPAGEPQECPASAVLTCSSSAVECEGGCLGECLLPSTTCAGACAGECVLDGTVACPGDCQGEADFSGNCTGVCVPYGAPCPGVCNGTCDLVVAGICEGECLGECTYQPASGCGANEQVHCSASASDAVSCLGACDGELSPQIAAECEATVEAFSVLVGQCPVPDAWVRYEVSAEAQASLSGEDRLQFDTRMRCHALQRATVATVGAHAGLLLRATQSLLSRGEVFEVLLELLLEAEPDNPQLVCATVRLPASQTALGEIALQLSETLQTTAQLSVIDQ